ncbi:MAG: hypothetical protein U0667_17555, partial [Chloroflexota bacterium]
MNIAPTGGDARDTRAGGRLDQADRELILGAVGSAPTWALVSSRMRDSSGHVPVALAAHQAAFDYMLVLRSSIELRSRVGVFGPMWEIEGRVYPMPLDLMPPEAEAEWQEALTWTEPPLLRSRYADLLWCRRAKPRPDSWARAAIDGYRALGATATDEYLTRTDSLIRALEIALELRDMTTAKEITESIILRATESLETEPDKPGIPLSLLEAIVSAPREIRPDGVLDTIERAEQLYDADPHLADSVADLMAPVLERTRLSPMRERQVRRWMRAGRQSDGMKRLFELRRALELADLHGLRDLAATLRPEVQAAAAADMDLKEIAGEITIPTSELRKEIDCLVGADSLSQALARIGSSGPLTGDPGRNRQVVEDGRRDHPLSCLVTTQYAGPEGTILREPKTEEEKVTARVSQHEALQAQVSAQLILVPALEQLVARYGRPTVEELAVWLRAPWIDDAVAAQCAAGIDLYLDGQANFAGHVLVPRIERMVRALAR